ncbi:hypothetical protein Lepto7375DRAFT_7257 [Leptolyngbya sp. PCC 7375]|nr:hypothetical protein Lepto7375DRAFT_7257 [Leptolyngbya sp. PCC 7375]
MNKNRVLFLEQNAKLLLRLLRAEKLDELEPILRPGAVSAIEWLLAVKKKPGSTYAELATAMSSNEQTAGQTLRALADGGAIRQEILSAQDSDSGRQEVINFIEGSK